MMSNRTVRRSYFCATNAAHKFAPPVSAFDPNESDRKTPRKRAALRAAGPGTIRDKSANTIALVPDRGVLRRLGPRPSQVGLGTPPNGICLLHHSPEWFRHRVRLPCCDPRRLTFVCQRSFAISR